MSAYDALFEAAAKQHGIDASLLRAQAMTESNFNPTAVSKDEKGNPVAYGIMQFTPATAKSMGIDPMKPEEAIPAAAKLLRQNIDSAGDERSGLMMYHGGTDQNNWGPKTQAYPEQVYNNQARIVRQRLAGNDPVMQFLANGKAPAAAEDSQPTADPVYDFFNSGGANTPAAVKETAPAKPKGTLQTLFDPHASETETNFLKGAASLADNVYGAVPGAVGALGYAARRVTGTPEEAAATQANISGALDKPIGKAFGITEDPAYQNEASNKALKWIGDNIHKGSEWVSEHTGIPTSDVENIASSLQLLAPGTVGTVAKPVGKAMTGMADRFNAMKGEIPVNAPPAPIEQLPPRPMAGGGAASSNLNPYPQLSGEAVARDGSYPVMKTSLQSADRSLPEQSVVANVVNQIVGNGKIRDGVLLGNEDMLRNEHTLAKKASDNPHEPDPVSQAYKTQIADEQKALTNYAQQRVEATGASSRFNNDEQRGQNFNNLVNGEGGITGFIDGLTKNLYKEAENKIGSNAVETPGLNGLLENPQFENALEMKGVPNFINGLRKSYELFKTTGLEDIDGNPTPPNSLAGLEALRQEANQSWSPANSRAVARVVRTIDKDGLTAGGGDLYEKSRGLYSATKTIFDSPGAKNLFGEYDKNGVMVGRTPVDKIMAKLNNMPTDQWQHIHDTFGQIAKGILPGAPEGLTVPANVREMAAQVQREMAGNLAREVYEQGASKMGPWNQNSANKAMNNLEDKINIAMTPDEVAKFHTLNLGGQLMPGQHSYEGAAQQANRMSKPGFIESHLPSVAAMAGDALSQATRVPGLGWVAGRAGQQAAENMSSKARVKLAQDIDAKMQANAKLNKSP